MLTQKSKRRNNLQGLEVSTTIYQYKLSWKQDKSEIDKRLKIKLKYKSNYLKFYLKIV